MGPLVIALSLMGAGAAEVIRFAGHYPGEADGRRTVVFRLYASETGSQVVWTEEQSVAVESGWINVLLGQGRAFGTESHRPLKEVFARPSATGWWVGATFAGRTSAYPQRHRLPVNHRAVAADYSQALIGAAGERFNPFSGAPVQIGGALQTSSGAERGSGAVDLQVVRLEDEQVASGARSVVGGGYANLASGSMSLVAGGFRNAALGKGVAIGGGGVNVASNDYSGIAAGAYNEVFADHGFIGGGKQNQVMSHYSTIGGGSGNEVRAPYAQVAGGQLNRIEPPGQRGSIGGGYANHVTQGYGAVGGGRVNRVNAEGGVIPGGLTNVVKGIGGAVGGGEHNEAGGRFSAVAGGSRNRSVGEYAFVAGGRGNWAGHGCFAAGTTALARHPGAFVWADRSDGSFETTQERQFLVRAHNGVGINTNAPDATLHVNGDALIEGDLGVGAALAVAGALRGNSLVTSNALSVGTEASRSGVHLDSEKLGREVAGRAGAFSILRSEVNSADSRWDFVHQRADRNLALYHNGEAVMMLGPERGDLWFSNSDRRLKQDIESLPDGTLDKLRELPVRRFRFRGSAPNGRRTGVIAQEVRELFPEAVREVEGYLAVDYARFGIYSVAAIQELSRETDELKQENARLTETLGELLARVRRLETRGRTSVE